MNQNLYSHLSFLPELNTSIRFHSAHFQKVNPGWRTHRASHDVFEILVVVSGKQKSIINDKEYECNEGDIVLLVPGTPHTNYVEGQDNLSYFTAHFDVDEPLLRYIFMKNLPLVFMNNTIENYNLSQILNKWMELYRKVSPFTIIDKIRIIQILTQLIIELILISDNYQEEQNNSRSLLIARSLAETIQYEFQQMLHIKINPKKISMKYIYSSVNVSPSYRLEAFKEVYGISPKKYLDQLKFHEAKRLLSLPEMSINDISEKLGYENVAHFSRQFKIWSGLPPSVYAKVRFIN